jgi:hypothetical protein
LPIRDAGMATKLYVARRGKGKGYAGIVNAAF